MVVNYLNVVRIRFTPDEADPPLVVDADAPLALPVALQLLEPIRWRNRQIFKSHGGIQHAEFPDRYLLQIGRKLARPLEAEQPFRLVVRPALDHLRMLTAGDINVQRY
jgi:hypothetical protein